MQRISVTLFVFAYSYLNCFLSKRFLRHFFLPSICFFFLTNGKLYIMSTLHDRYDRIQYHANNCWPETIRMSRTIQTSQTPRSLRHTAFCNISVITCFLSYLFIVATLLHGSCSVTSPLLISPFTMNRILIRFQILRIPH